MQNLSLASFLQLDKSYFLLSFGDPFFKCSDLDVELPLPLRKLESVFDESCVALAGCQHSFLI